MTRVMRACSNTSGVVVVFFTLGLHLKSGQVTLLTQVES